jgi:hypothetical protein
MGCVILIIRIDCDLISGFGRGRVPLPRAIHPANLTMPDNIRPMILVDCENSALGEVTSPLRDGGFDCDRTSGFGRGRVSLPRAIHPAIKPIPDNIKPMILVDCENSALGEVTSPLRDGGIDCDRWLIAKILHWAGRPRPYGYEI